ncbi:sensor histidine kinase [Polynucleobacter corsicus]|uniref:sensor histidine kinase n=1 Tax=Polynucleobacter corsicus TaxID=2081042 RepID=UPI001BFE330D|nr:HAMP domain-containing sensor histidine kinase [Polynucleobacter corsicus]QWE19313.1 HAMP domain-containing histidine kinase [Polynucleobacter corsicus]
MPDPQTDTATQKSQGLEEAFDLFIEASKALEAQQAVLQGQLNELSSQLIAANSRLSSLLNSLPAGVILAEHDQLIDFNPAAAHFIPELTKGMPWKIPGTWKSSNSPGDHLRRQDDKQQTTQIYEVKAGITGAAGEHSRQLADKQQILQILEVKTGARSVIQIQDISSAIANRAEEERMSRLTAMGKMSAGIAHQLRTPLSTALLYASHLADQNITDDQKQLFADRLRKQLISLEKLASNMLLFLKQRPQQTTPVAVHELLEEACQAAQGLSQERNIELKLSLECPHTLVNVEKHSIISAFVAILENAIQVSEPGQLVEISCHDQPNQTEIIIEDYGPGIAENMMDTIFEPFSSGRVTGNGLGLSIARSNIESHRGQILVSNRPNGGARFTISLPSLTEL